MNEFEKEMLSMMKAMQSDINDLKSDISTMKNDINTMKSDIDELKESTVITRSAANYNGEKLDELITILKGTNVIA